MINNSIQYIEIQCNLLLKIMRVSNRSGKPENNAPKATYDFL